MDKELKEETKYLENLIAMEDLAEKKTKIYARLLIDSALAGEMEGLSIRHAERKKILEKLLYDRGRYALNDKKESK